MKEQDRGDTMNDNEKNIKTDAEEEIEILEIEDSSVTSESKMNLEEINTSSTLEDNQATNESTPIINNENIDNVKNDIVSNSFEQPVGNINNNSNYSSNIKQNFVKSEDNNSNFKYIMTIILFIFLFVIIFFLPDISKFFSELEKNNSNLTEEKITTGTLKCISERHDENFDYEYLSEFEFENNSLLTLNYITTTTGDESVDREALETMYENCQTLKSNIENLSGVSVTCSLNKGVFIENQLLTYASIEVNEITSAYSEAGGIYPNFEKGDNIDTIESGMKSSGYTCERER